MNIIKLLPEAIRAILREELPRELSLTTKTGDPDGHYSDMVHKNTIFIHSVHTTHGWFGDIHLSRDGDLQWRFHGRKAHVQINDPECWTKFIAIIRRDHTELQRRYATGRILAQTISRNNINANAGN